MRISVYLAFSGHQTLLTCASLCKPSFHLLWLSLANSCYFFSVFSHHLPSSHSIYYLCNCIDSHIMTYYLLMVHRMKWPLSSILSWYGPSQSSSCPLLGFLSFFSIYQLSIAQTTKLQWDTIEWHVLWTWLGKVGVTYMIHMVNSCVDLLDGSADSCWVASNV